MATFLLKGGRVIDPACGVDGIRDVLVAEGRIQEIAPEVEPHAARDRHSANRDRGGDDGGVEIIDCRGRLVLPGLIDTHAHVYQHVTGSFGLNADLCGVQSGVTTLVDQGGPSCMTLPGFRHFVAEPATTRVVAFLSAYLVGGLEGHYYSALYRPDCLDIDATVRAADANRDLVKGIKAHAELGGFARWGVEVIKSAAEIGRRARLPVYIHFGQLWPLPHQDGKTVDPDTILTQVLDLMKPDDILAHPFSRHPGGFVGKNGQLHPLVREAVARGLKIDVGHGSHFSFNVARTVLDAGIIPDTLGADMHGHNTRAANSSSSASSAAGSEGDAHLFAGKTRFSLVSTMTSMLALGLSLEQVVPMVTSNAARMLGLQQDAGHLRVGGIADISVLSDERGSWLLRDDEGTQVRANRLLQPLFCMRAGQLTRATAPILPSLSPA
jgi:dihydroorotase